MHGFEYNVKTKGKFMWWKERQTSKGQIIGGGEVDAEYERSQEEEDGRLEGEETMGSLRRKWQSVVAEKTKKG